MIEGVPDTQIERSWRMRRYVSPAAAIAAVTTTFVLALSGSALGATISSFAPITGSVDDGCTVVTITGTGLLDATGVSFNGVPASWFQAAPTRPCTTGSRRERRPGRSP